MEAAILEAKTIVRPDMDTESGVSSDEAARLLGAILALPTELRQYILELSFEDRVLLFKAMATYAKKRYEDSMRLVDM